VPALVLGDTSGLDPALSEDFRATGLTHLTAVSGANLTLLLAFLLTVARWVGLRGWNLRIVGLVAVIIFVALCRTEPSVLRAAAMGLVALAALGSALELLDCATWQLRA
jgi:competence protein ComEC